MIPQGYKHTKIGIIPKGWEIKQIRDVGKVVTGSTPPTNDESCFGSEYMFVTPADIVGTKYIIDTERKLSSKGFSASRKMPKGCILFTCIGSTIGKMAIAATELTSNQQINAIICHDIDNDYLFYGLFYQRNRIRLLAGEQAVPIINKSDFERIKIAVPPIEEQKKIASILNEWDKAIELQTKLFEKQELRKRALMQRLLTGRVRLNGFSDKWQVKLLCELGTFEKGYGVPKEQIREKGHKAITYGEIYTQYDYVIKKFASFIDDATAEISKSISCGAILFAGSGETLEDIGKCVAYVDNDIAYAGGDIIIFNPNPDINSLVLSYYLNYPSAIIQKRRYGQGHSVVHIYTKDLAKIKVLLPSLAEQTAIAEVLISADKEIEIAKNKLSSLRNQKRGLMQQLLTGKKRIK